MQTIEHGAERVSQGQVWAAIGEERKTALEALAVRNYRSVSAELRLAIDDHLGGHQDERQGEVVRNGR